MNDRLVDCCFSVWGASSTFPVSKHHGQVVIFDENKFSMLLPALSKVMRLNDALFSRKVTWLIVVPPFLALSSCFRDRVEEHRDVRIFFIEELKRYSISTSLLESDLLLVDCFYQSVPYLGYWLVGNSPKPGDIFIRRYDPDKVPFLFSVYVFKNYSVCRTNGEYQVLNKNRNLEFSPWSWDRE